MPPGLAKKRYDDDDDDEEEVVYRWRRGDYIYDDDYRLIDYPNRYTLPPLRPGERYAIVGNQIVKINSETGRILDLMPASGRHHQLTRQTPCRRPVPIGNRPGLVASGLQTFHSGSCMLRSWPIRFGAGQQELAHVQDQCRRH